MPVCSCKGGNQISRWENFSSAHAPSQWSAQMDGDSKQGCLWADVLVSQGSSHGRASSVPRNSLVCLIFEYGTNYFRSRLEKTEGWNRKQIVCCCCFFLIMGLLRPSLTPMLNLEHRFSLPFTYTFSRTSPAVLVAGANQPENGNRLNIKGSQLACSQHSPCVVLMKDKQSIQVLQTSHNVFKSSRNKNIHHDTQIIGKTKTQTLYCWTWMNVAFKRGEKRVS